MRFRSIKWLFVLQALVLGFLVLASSFRVFELHYPRVIENSPLIAPVKVQSFSANKLVLDDGRTFDVSWTNHPDVALVIQKSDNFVDLHFYSATDVEVYAKGRTFICGNSWQGLVEIPLIPVDVPRYRRELVALAKVSDPSAPLSE